MKRKLLITSISLLLLTLVACGRGQPEVPVGRAAVPGLDHPLRVGDAELTVLEARLRENFQISYIMHFPQASSRFLELMIIVRGVEDPLMWSEEQLTLVVQGELQDPYYRRPAPSEMGNDRFLLYFQIPDGATLEEAYLQLATGDQVDLAYLHTEPSETMMALSPPDLGTVGGGVDNRASGRHAVVAGGSENSARAAHAVVAGGTGNSASVQYASIGGGEGNRVDGTRGTIGGGHRNAALQLDSTVSGGARNTAAGTHSTVGGGSHNEANGRDATIGGGTGNSADGTNATVAGGAENTASGFGSTVGGGAGNLATENHAVVAGGLGNEATGVHASVAGGNGNQATGAYATIPGGLLNIAAAPHSLAAGQRAHVNAAHSGAMVFADSSAVDFHSASADEFAVRAMGGVRFVTDLDEGGLPAAGVLLPAGSGSWSSLSSRAAKAGIRPVDSATVLTLVTQMPISTWYYRGQEASIQHMGPMAEDFQVFGLGEEGTHISSIDADGVSLAAIQGLYALVEKQESRLAEQDKRLEAMEAQLRRAQADDPSPAWLWMGTLVTGLVLGALLSYLLISIKGDTVGRRRLVAVRKHDDTTRV